MDLASGIFKENAMPIHKAKNACASSVSDGVFLIKFLGRYLQGLGKALSFWPSDIDPCVVPARMATFSGLLAGEGEAISPPRRVVLLSYWHCG
jgi:hypothetical protein